MPLNLNELQSNQAELSKQKNLIEKKLAAINSLIDAMLEETGYIKVKNEIPKKRGAKPQPNSIAAIARRELESYTGREFETSTIADLIIQRGLAKSEEHERVRNIVYSVLRDWLKSGFVNRENRSKNNNPNWVYWKLKREKVGQN